MHRVHFHAVHTRFLAHFRGLTVGVDDVLDLFFGECAAGDVLRPSGRQLAGRCADVGRIEDGLHQRAHHLILDGQREQLAQSKRTAESGCQLHEEFRTRLVDLVHIGFEFLESALRFVKPLSADEVSQRRDAGDDEPDVILRALEEESSRVLIEVMRLHPTEQRRSPHGTEHDAVLYLHIADLPRSEQRFVDLVHNGFPPLRAPREADPPAGALRHTAERRKAPPSVTL